MPYISPLGVVGNCFLRISLYQKILKCNLGKKQLEIGRYKLVSKRIFFIGGIPLLVHSQLRKPINSRRTFKTR
jgi:hypothetical protein